LDLGEWLGRAALADAAPIAPADAKGALGTALAPPEHVEAFELPVASSWASSLKPLLLLGVGRETTGSVRRVMTCTLPLGFHSAGGLVLNSALVESGAVLCAGRCHGELPGPDGRCHGELAAASRSLCRASSSAWICWSVSL
jgi:hypothetical protein